LYELIRKSRPYLRIEVFHFLQQGIATVTKEGVAIKGRWNRQTAGLLQESARGKVFTYCQTGKLEI